MPTVMENSYYIFVVHGGGWIMQNLLFTIIFYFSRLSLSCPADKYGILFISSEQSRLKKKTLQKDSYL